MPRPQDARKPPSVATQLTPKTASDAFAPATPAAKPEKPRFSLQAAQALRAVTVASTGEGKFTQKVTAGGTTYNTDEPIELGGLDKGPNPYEELLSALGACTSMKMRRFAQENEYPLQHISVTVSHHKEKEADGKVVDKFQRDITLKGNLSDDQRQKLLDIANACPIHQTLMTGPKVVTVLANANNAGAKPAAPAAPRM